MFSVENFLYDLIGFLKKIARTFFHSLVSNNTFSNRVFKNREIDLYSSPSLYFVIIVTFYHTLIVYNTYIAEDPKEIVSFLSREVVNYTLSQKILFSIPLITFLFILVNLFSLLFPKAIYRSRFYNLSCYFLGTFLLLYLIAFYSLYVYYSSLLDDDAQYYGIQITPGLKNKIDLLIKNLKYIFSILLVLVIFLKIKNLRDTTLINVKKLYAASPLIGLLFLICIFLTKAENRFLYKMYPVESIIFQEYPLAKKIHITDSSFKLNINFLVSNKTETACYLEASDTNCLYFLKKDSDNMYYIKDSICVFLNSLNFSPEIEKDSDQFLILKAKDTKQINFTTDISVLEHNKLIKLIPYGYMGHLALMFRSYDKNFLPYPRKVFIEFK